MRLFIATFLPEKVKKEIKTVQEKLKSTSLYNGRDAELENLHLTLKFIGEVEEEKAEEIKKSLKKVKNEIVEAKIVSGGMFTPNNPKILWLEMTGAEELQRKIDEEMATLGFKKEERFMSHLTINRIKQMNKASVNKLMEEIQNLNLNIEFKIDKFSLVESELTPSGPKYKVVEEYKLK